MFLLINYYDIMKYKFQEEHFSATGLTFRHTLFSNYKMNRSPTPDTVTQSLRYVKPALTAMGMKTIEVAISYFVCAVFLLAA